MKIQELERRTGLERPSIRFYEKEGLLNPKRLENGYRDYSEDDVELLKKIKLLRRLGMGIEQIRNLQQGSEDLSQAVAVLSATHSSQIDEHIRCRAVCETMHADKADFGTLDAEHYLKLLRDIQVNEKTLGRTDFQEELPRESHPWRRCFARWLDYGLWSAIVSFVYIVLLRVRPLPGDFGSALITIAGMVIYVPLEAMMLWKFGTTPGKFALGIRLESIQGGNLTWEEALNRSCQVFIKGCGCCVPLLEQAMNIVCYGKLRGRFARGFILAGPQEMDWDEDTEIIYRNVNFKRGAVVALILVLEFSISIFSGFDGIRPKYRGNTMTIQQFSENYNAYLRVFHQKHETYEELEEDGSWKPAPQNTVVTDFNDDRSNHRMEFEYALEGEFIESISIHHDWNNVFYLAPLTNEPFKLAGSILLAQENCGYQELKEFAWLYQIHMYDMEARIEYKNIVVEWSVLTNAEVKDGVLIFDEEDDYTAELQFSVTIN